jgi:hypothetical protein
MCRTAFRVKIAIPCRHSWHRVAGFVSRWTASERATEATQADVDFHGGTLHIRHSKFDKSRLIPIAADLVKHLVHCRTLTTEKVGSCLYRDLWALKAILDGSQPATRQAVA